MTTPHPVAKTAGDHPLPQGEGTADIDVPSPCGRGVGVRRCLALLLLTAPLFAATAAKQDPILAQVRFDQRLNNQVPLKIRFTDESGNEKPLAEYLHGKPAILNLVYFECPMLCTETLNGLTRALRSLRWTAGDQFNVLSVSFNPQERPHLAAAKKRNYLALYGRPQAAGGWFFLTGAAEPVRRLTDAVGFRYAYDPQLKQYAHPTGLVILTPDGQVSRYLFGAEYSPRDLRLALTEAGAGKIGSPTDRLLLTCYHYDPLTGRYNLAIFQILKIGAIVTLLILGVAVFRGVRLATPNV
jgi:protein SCO1/2